MNYYLLDDYASNSDLGSLDDALNQIEKPDNIQEIYDFGNLVDTMITEPHFIDFDAFTVKQESQILTFDKTQFERGIRMKNALEQNPFFNMILQDSRFQYVFLRKKFEFEYMGYKYVIPARCKFDIHNKKFKIGSDIKTTACTNQKSFNESMTFFNYDRQGAWYMDLAKLDKMVYFGISKKQNKHKKHDVFTYAISRGDVTYEAGKKKYQKLAYLYKHLILNLHETN